MPGISPEMNSYRQKEAQRFTPERIAGNSSVEAQPSHGERGETHELQPAQVPADPAIMPALPAQQILPKPVSQTPSSATPPPPTSSLPVTDDEDLIEKAWVEKAKKIIQETKGDPYSQEHEVSKLQADYIKKRYGKDIKITSD